MKSSDVAFFNPAQQGLDWTELLALAQQNGGDYADIFWERSDTTQIVKKSKAVETLRQGTDEGVGVRVIVDGQTIYGYTNDLSAQGVGALAVRVSEGVKAVKRDRVPLLELRLSERHSVVEQRASAASLGQKIDLVNRLEGRAWSKAHGVQQVIAGFMDKRRQTLVARSDGWVAIDDHSAIVMRLEVVGEGASGTQSASDRMGGHWGLEQFGTHTPEKLADETLRQLGVLLIAKPAPSGLMPVVLGARAGGTMVHEAVGHGLEADLALQGLSVYAGREGQEVASKLVSVVDDGTLPSRRGTHDFDDEGTPTKKNLLVDKGVLKSFMFDQKMALKTGGKSTGNGRRQSYKFAPMVRMTNTYIAPGPDTPDQILRDTPWGLYVAQMGGGQVDTVTGNFGFQVTEAYLIRNGELHEPVCGAMLTGNGPEVLKIVDRVGSDLGWGIGICGKTNQHVPVTDAQPTMRVPQLTVGGTVPITKYFSDR